jgi:hypothetical protein
MRATCPTHVILLNFIAISLSQHSYLVMITNYTAHYAVASGLLLFQSSYAPIFSSARCCQASSGPHGGSSHLPNDEGSKRL